MRKFRLYLVVFLAVMLICATFAGCGKSGTTKLTKVRLNEVTRSVFYAPFYVAMNEGYFKEEGLDIDLTIGEGADKTMQQVMSNSADIGFCGPEQTIYINGKNKDNYPILFAQLTQTDGSFLVGRKAEANFDWSSLKGKTIVGGRPGGVPEMSLEYVLKKNGLENGKNVNIITNIAFAAAPGAYKSGTGDYAAIFEPTASSLTKDGLNFIVASVGQAAGTIPYTCYFTTKDYMASHKDIIEKFTRAIYKGQKWTLSHSDAQVASEIKSFFPGNDQSLLISVVKNYRSINAYADSPVLKEEDMNRMMDIIESYDKTLLPTRPAFSKIVNTEIAAKVVNDLK